MAAHRDRLCNDVTNTAVAASLVGGFALGNLDGMIGIDGRPINYVLYMMSVFSIHACTCSALTSALLYRKINGLPDECVEEWELKHVLLLMMPVMKFGMGCAVYLGTVILMSYRDLDAEPSYQWTSVGIGIMSMSTVAITVLIMAFDKTKSRRPELHMPSMDDMTALSGQVTGQMGSALGAQDKPKAAAPATGAGA